MTGGRIHLLGVPIDAVSQAEVLARLHAFLDAGEQHPTSAPGAAVGRHVATPNNEILVAASRDDALRALLQRTALNLPDSTGLLLMARLRGEKLPERVTGTDTVQRLCETLGPEHSVFLLGAGEGVAERMAEALKQRNPRLRIADTFAGSPRDEDAAEIIRRINAVSPHLLFVAYGAPAQERWIDRHLTSLPSVRVAMGIGGAFDFLAGVQKRAPRWMQATGLEWFWRVVREPRRLPRIFTAVIVFPFLCLRESIRLRAAAR